MIYVCILTLLPDRYSKVVKQPMSYGSIIRLLVEAKYKSIDGVIADAKVLADNCAKWFASENGVSVSEAKHQVQPLMS